MLFNIQYSKTLIKCTLSLFILLSTPSAWSESDKEYHGVFYGLTPCEEKDCEGIKTTLALKNKNNYLLVTQKAKASSREYFDKGKYEWNEEENRVVLSSKKTSKIIKFEIKDDSTIIQLDEQGKPMWPKGKTKANYVLRRNNSVKPPRTVHTH